MEQIPIRKIFWDALEMALEAQSHRLARDIAASLQVDETPLLKALKTEKVQVYLYDDTADGDYDMSEMKCRDIVRLHEGSPFLKRCLAPVVWPNSKIDACQHKCLQHRICPSEFGADVSTTEQKVVQSITVENAQFYLDSSGILYKSSGEVAGRLNSETGVYEILELS